MNAPAPKQPQSPGAMIDHLFELRERYRALGKEQAEVKEQMDDIEFALLGALDSVGLQMGRGGRASATVTEQIVPTVVDWDAVEQYVYENEALYLLQRRVSPPAWRELVEAGESVPGTEPYTKRGISLRKI
jgi:hypothetical protein